MTVSGTYDVTVNTPMGDQSGTFTVRAEGETFTGTMTGGLGAIEIQNGTVSGNTLNWQMDMKVPMPMTLDCTATVEGDNITGEVRAGAFGALPLSGVRAKN